MPWYPGAQRMELQPESRDQPVIVPTQFIMHSIAAPWDEQRIYEYWRDSTNLESTFGLDFDGSMGQFLNTTTHADANYKANAHAVSIETASNLEHTDPWADAQVEQLIRLGVWLHQTHGIPLRICRTWDDPGYGYHALFREWSTSGTACPGPARIRQFHDRVFPGIVARATGQTTQEDDMPLTDADVAKVAAATAAEIRGIATRDGLAWATRNYTGDGHASLVELLETQRAELAAQRAVLATLLDRTDGVDTATVIAAITASADRAFAKGLDIHLTTTPTTKES